VEIKKEAIRKWIRKFSLLTNALPADTKHAARTMHTLSITLLLLLSVFVISITGDRQFSRSNDASSVLDISTGWYYTQNNTYTKPENFTHTEYLEGFNHPQYVLYFGFSSPPNSYTEAGIYFNDFSQFIIMEDNTVEEGYVSAQAVLAPCEVPTSNITFIASVANFSSLSNQPAFIVASFSPVSTQLFVSGGLSGIQTAYCCETYYYFNIPSDGNHYDVSILLQTVNPLDQSVSVPFTSACIKSGSCPTNSNDSCISWAAPSLNSNSFHFEGKKLEAGDYYVRLETPIYQGSRSQQYNITATRDIHKESPVVSWIDKHLDYVIGGSIGGVLLILVVIIVVVVVRKRRAEYDILR